MGLIHLNKIIFTFVFGSLLLFNCNPFKDDDLSLKRENYTGNQLRTNGYYYVMYKDSSYVSTHFLFKNGIVLNTLVVDYFKNFSITDSILSNTEYISKVKQTKYHWGIYKIRQDSIILERWTPGPPRNTTYISCGKILNDSTFVLTKIRGERAKKDIVYHFRQFSPKLDSITDFIE